MTASETGRRRDQIVALLRRNGEMAVSALAEEMAVTVQTLRSDLRALDEARIVRRRHGVAALNAMAENIGYQPRQDLARGEKARIAAALTPLARREPSGAVKGPRFQPPESSPAASSSAVIRPLPRSRCSRSS